MIRETPVLIAKVVAVTPAFCQGDTLARPRPEASETSKIETEAAVAAPAMMAAQETADAPRKAAGSSAAPAARVVDCILIEISSAREKSEE
jgi:hypothetical protein